MRANAPRSEAGLAIVGSFDSSHLGGSLRRAARHLGIDTIDFDVRDAQRGSRILRTAAWHLAGHRPLRLKQFAADIVAACSAARPDILIATGAAPLTVAALGALRAMGVVCVNYSTDDPWNPTMRAPWHLPALPEYDLVCTTRRSNIEDLTRLGCTEVRYLPFGYDTLYDEWTFQPPERPAAAPPHDVLFVGGADRDRVAFMTEFMRNGPPVALVGGYWERFPAMRPHALGQLPPDVVAALTVAAKVNLCLVRRANRDGHVMRSFEIAALGGCMLAEDTEEHREIFGSDGESVAYFRTPAEAAQRARRLLADAAERERLACAVRARIAQGAHTYRDRLATMLRAAGCLHRGTRAA